MSLRYLAGVVASVSLLGAPARAEDPCLPGAPVYESGTYTAVLPFAGEVERTFRVHVPDSYDRDAPEATPLVLIFHGWGGDENEFLSSEIVIREAERRGAILVAPRGLGSEAPDRGLNSWSFLGSSSGLDGFDRPICEINGAPEVSYRSCGRVGDPTAVAKNACGWTHCQSDDILFALDLIEVMGQNLCIDRTRVFAVGGSNGAMLTWNLGQDPRSAKRFSAIAALIGLPHRGYLSAKARVGNLPALVISGTEDITVPPGEWEDPSFTASGEGEGVSYFYASATAITRSWARAHGCSTQRPAIPFTRHRSGYDCRTYCAGDRGWPRVLDCRVAMTHRYDFVRSWPLILDFFQAHSDGETWR